MADEFKDRLNNALEIRNMKAVELSDATGISKARISQYVNGVYVPKSKATYSIAKALNINETWLMGYDVPMERSNVSEKSNAEILPTSEIRMIPVFETVSAGFGAYASSDIVDYMPLYIENDYEAEETLCIKVKGDSMYPKIEDEDIIQVHKQDSVENGQIAVVMIDNEEGLVKKIYIYSDYLELQSINPEYPPKKFEKEQMNRVNIVGIVRKIIKEC